MQAHEQRVIEEKKELDQKLEKLNAFTGTPTFSALGEEDTMLLLKQLRVMEQYSSILQQRIDRFDSCEAPGGTGSVPAEI